MRLLSSVLAPAVLAVALFASLLGSPSASAQSADCMAVRRARALARATGLDAPNFAQLEQLACGGPLDLRGLWVVARPSADCLRLTEMWALAAAVESEDTMQIDGTRVAVCRTGALGELDEWPNGTRIRSGTAWRYPSGARFSAVGNALLYPTGQTARDSNGVWHYPDGVEVDPDTDRFHLPGGGVVESQRELIAWACSRVGASRCEVLDTLPAAWIEVRGSLLTMLLWEGRPRR